MLFPLHGNAYLLPVKHRSLIFQLVRRDILSRYRGSLLGMGWSLVTPMLMLGVYTFVFVGVFRARWPGAEQGGGVEFALQMLAGLMVFNLFAEMAAQAPRLVLDQANLVTKVVFPLEILPWVKLLSGLFYLVLNALVLVLATWLVRGTLPPTALVLPLVMLPLLPFLLGLGWLLAALGVYVRDVGHAMGLVVNLAMFLSPVFYSAHTLAPEWQGALYANPLTLVIESVRQVVLQGVWPNVSALLLYSALALGFAALGGVFFDTTRKGFTDVL